MSFDAIILGAGAAGCMAAIQAGRRGLKVCLLDQAKRVGGKIPISGGGRCNFTNQGAAHTHYYSSNPDFCRSALAAFSAADTEAWVRNAGIPYHEKHKGQLFCDRSAMDIVELLERDLAAAGVELQLNARIEGFERTGAGFRAWGPGFEHSAPKAVLALGGASYPVLGASEIGLQFARALGLKVLPTAPALDGFVLSAEDLGRFEDLQGIALPVTLRCGGRSFEEDLLFTHRGLSGPAALQGSLYWQPGTKVAIDLWPGADAAEALLSIKRTQPRASLSMALGQRWPKRLAERWQSLCGSDGLVLERISDKALRAVAETLQPWTLQPAGTTGWHKAEVMRGGVDTAELSQKTLEAKRVPGLFVIGEVVDMTGELGGYNFQWAWSSGFVAGNAL